MNWNKFAIKNENKEQWAFEQMAYLLFCSEFNNNIGLFRYKNQTGIETEPLKKDGIIYGFSAKYYEVSVNDRKKEINTISSSWNFCFDVRFIICISPSL